jgi:hypothetical protein
MTKIAKRLLRWLEANRSVLESIGADTDTKWSADKSLNDSAYIDGKIGEILFRIVVWENGQTELQVIVNDEEDCAILDETDANDLTLDDNLDRHLARLIAFINSTTR